MAWIAIQHETPDKPEVFHIAEVLGIEPDCVTGKLLRLWIWADQQTVDGSAPFLSAMLIDRIVAHSGFAEALKSAGWLGVDDHDNLFFPSFGDHNGDTAKTRLKATQRQANRRKRKAQETTASESTPEPPANTARSSGGGSRVKPPTIAVMELVEKYEALKPLAEVSIEPVPDDQYTAKGCLDILTPQTFTACWDAHEDTRAKARRAFVLQWYPKQLACPRPLLTNGNWAEATIVLASILAMQSHKASGKPVANKVAYWRKVVSSGNWADLITDESMRRAVAFLQQQELIDEPALESAA